MAEPRFVTAAEVEGGVLPVGGTTDQVLAKKSDASFDLKWAPVGGGGTPGGSDTHVQFNDGGAFGGDPNHAWDKTNKTLTLKASVGGAGDVLDLYDSNGTKVGSIYIDETPFIELLLAVGTKSLDAIVSPTTSTLTVADGSTGSVQLNGVNSSIFLRPMASAPTPPAAGMIYHSTDTHFYGYNGTTWKQLDN